MSIRILSYPHIFCKLVTISRFKTKLVVIKLVIEDDAADATDLTAALEESSMMGIRDSSYHNLLSEIFWFYERKI